MQIAIYKIRSIDIIREREALSPDLVNEMKSKYPNKDIDYTLDKLKVQLTEHTELIDRNYKLMQLEDVDISGTTKVKLLDHLDNNKPQLQKYNFEKLFMEDRLFTNLPNIDSWLNQHFLRLDGYMKK